MVQMDRTVKVLLGLIALFLGILALKPFLQVATSAQAQSAATTTSSDPSVSLGSVVTNVATVMADTGKAVRGVYAMDSTHAFIIQYDGYFKVYGIRDVPAGSTTAKAPSSFQLSIPSK